MIILGVDPGSVVTGFGLIQSDGNKSTHIHSGPVRLKKEGAIPLRLLALSRALKELINTYQPEVLAVEKVFHGVNVQSTLRLGYVRGVIILEAASAGLDIHEYASTEVKRAVTGYGRAEKHQVQDMVRILLNLPKIPKPHDVADALAIAITHAHSNPLARLHHKH